MPKYEVIKPWHGVRAGQIVELKEVHESLVANVRAVGDGADDGEDGTDQVLASARKEARQIIAEARAGAAAILDEAKAQAAKLVPPVDAGERREVIKARLKELKIEFDGRKGEEDLAALLPEGELAKLFPAE